MKNLDPFSSLLDSSAPPYLIHLSPLSKWLFIVDLL